jgi:D-alanyl-D-alanine dipeptidase
MGIRGPQLVTAILVIATMTGLFGQTASGLGEDKLMPKEFVYLRDIDPSILQDVKYAGYDNFTGRPVPGYAAAECVLLRPIAEALKRVQADLAAQNLSLKVYDCYRPQRAAKAFVQWTKAGEDSTETKRFYPRLKKSDLLAAHYISAASGHSRGIAVDLTLVKLPAAPQAAFDPKGTYGPCSGPAEARAPDNSIDMGTGFDCFDPKSHAANAEISADQRQWRQTLVAAMARHQFKNYVGEWWHFTYQMASSTDLPAYDFPILPRSKSTQPGH